MICKEDSEYFYCRLFRVISSINICSKSFKVTVMVSCPFSGLQLRHSAFPQPWLPPTIGIFDFTFVVKLNINESSGYLKVSLRKFSCLPGLTQRRMIIFTIIPNDALIFGKWFGASKKILYEFCIKWINEDMNMKVPEIIYGVNIW